MMDPSNPAQSLDSFRRILSREETHTRICALKDWFDLVPFIDAPTTWAQWIKANDKNDEDTWTRDVLVTAIEYAYERVQTLQDQANVLFARYTVVWKEDKPGFTVDMDRVLPKKPNSGECVRVGEVPMKNGAYLYECTEVDLHERLLQLVVQRNLLKQHVNMLEVSVSLGVQGIMEARVRRRERANAGRGGGGAGGFGGGRFGGLDGAEDERTAPMSCLKTLRTAAGLLGVRRI